MEAIFNSKYIDQKIFLDQHILPTIQPFHTQRADLIQSLTTKIILKAKEYKTKNPFEKLIHEYDLSSKEGVVLMCLAEALLRIPDVTTMNQLIEDKIPTGQWKEHINKQKDIFVNLSSIAFMFSGKIVDRSEEHETIFHNLMKKMSEPMLRTALKQGINILAKQFVFAENISAANSQASKHADARFNFSFDMLGEAALTLPDARRYFDNYQQAILTTGQNNQRGNSISIKLSALYPRYERNQLDRCLTHLLPSMVTLIELAMKNNVDICFDAEEADRLTLSLMLIEEIFKRKIITPTYRGFGIAVQAYQKRSGAVIQWLDQLCRQYDQPINVRLVKGAYWDTEIKIAQELGFEGYPVFTKKFLTDLNYLYCSHLLHKSSKIFPQFATHNAFSISYIHHLFQDKEFEFQKLHGMGDEIYSYFASHDHFRCRVYAPVGGYNDLLPYLVRRLLENGANTSFIHQLKKENSNVSELAHSPLQKIDHINQTPLPSPRAIFPDGRLNSLGVDLSEESNIQIFGALTKSAPSNAFNIVEGQDIPSSTIIDLRSPSNLTQVVGKVHYADQAITSLALEKLVMYSSTWQNYPVDQRCRILNNFADLLEQNYEPLVALCAQEAGKTIKDCLADIREAIDFCRYYSQQAERLFQINSLPGPTGEINEYTLKGKGLSLVISPWNFPIAIFVGQLVANLVCGNVTIAKPAEQSSLTAYQVFRLLLKAGLPANAASLLLGRGEEVCPFILAHPSLENVVFTGSLETAKIIQRNLAQHPKVINLIAETGGLNCLIADSSALTEQVVRDVVQSSFNSAGQRCSACRILLIEENVYAKTLDMLKGAMDCLVVGHPLELKTDMSAVIDQEAFDTIQSHLQQYPQRYQPLLPSSLQGYYIPPTLIEISSLEQMTREVFGPVLHICPYQSHNLKSLCEGINQLGFGLTLGIHSRIDSVINTVTKTCKVGNIYINRNIVGAVVGVQPFGGQGFSGTGPKAGGPEYLSRLCHEYSVSNNTTAMGGNATLLTSITD